MKIFKKNKSKFSNLNEEVYIKYYIEELNINHGFCVDIAAGDGINMSNTYHLFKEGWSGCAIELDNDKFSKLSKNYKSFAKCSLANIKITPLNIQNILQKFSCPIDFDFLNLDIDGYDYFVLFEILKVYRPKLMCVEINEKIPPPIKFTVSWQDDYCWNGDHFYGLSISKLEELASMHNYRLVNLHYNNAFLIPAELTDINIQNTEKLYKKGYLEKKDRHINFPWNSNVDYWQGKDPEKALKLIESYFECYKGKFSLEL